MPIQMKPAPIGKIHIMQQTYARRFWVAQFPSSSLPYASTEEMVKIAAVVSMKR